MRTTTRARSGGRRTGTGAASWRALARGRWIDGNATIPGSKARRDPATSPSVVRVEAGSVLEVFADDTVARAAAEPEAVGWHVAVDGRHVGTIVGRSEALEFALYYVSPRATITRAVARVGFAKVDAVLSAALGLHKPPAWKVGAR